MSTRVRGLVALGALLVSACMVPTLEELDRERLRACNGEHPCLPGHACVGGQCQAEEGTACLAGTTAACGQDTGECHAGTRACAENGLYGPCVGEVRPAQEVCNGRDDDCNGLTDEDPSCAGACAPCAAAGRTCVNDSCGACLEGYLEESSECRPKLALGAPCSSGEQCASGSCADGYCCDGACSGACERCDATPGQCTVAADGSAGSPSCAPYVCDGTARGCPTRCALNADCAPGTPCINNRCGDRLPLGASCSESAQCASGSCVGGSCCGSSSCTSPPSQCHQPGGSCSSGSCAYALKPSGSACNDGSACTVNDVCGSSGSCSGTPLACNSPPSQCHQATGTCSNGSCAYALKASGSACNDGNACTTNDVCNSSGTCLGSFISCNSPPSPCHQASGTCSNGSCSYALKSSGSTCDDGNGCTTNDMCSGSGVCAGSAISCDSPPGQCYQSTGTCQDGTCVYPYAPPGTSCDDGMSCTNSDQCNGSGACTGADVCGRNYVCSGSKCLCTALSCLCDPSQGPCPVE